MAMQGVIRPEQWAFDVTRLRNSRWMWCFGIAFCIMLRELGQGFGDLFTTQGDTDDAARIYQVRQFLATGAWFDMSLPRLGGATPLISHWSRLIDLPLALLLSGFGLFLSPETAELVVRIVWPMILLFFFLRLLLRAAEVQGAPPSAWLILFLATTCVSGLGQFKIGRIDHHNMMILGAVGGLLTLLDARRRPDVGWLAGGLIGLSLAVGYEPLLNIIVAITGFALWALWDTSWLGGIRRMAVAAAATMAAVFVATVAPSDWMVARCDALSLNMVVLFACGAAGLHFVDRMGRSWTFVGRLAVVAAAGALGLAGFAALDTRCLAGPFGQVSPDVKPIWLDFVVEGLPLFAIWKTEATLVLAVSIPMVVGIICAAERWWRLRTQETFAILALTVLTTPGGFWMIKLMTYQSWIAIFAIALSIADFKESPRLTALSRQLLGALFLNQWFFAAVALGVLSLFNSPSVSADRPPMVPHARCMTTPVIKTLQALPKGLFVTGVDYGSYIVALTHHDALAAPYHRIDQAIIEAHRIMTAEPDEALRRLTAVGADYVSICAADVKADAPTVAADGKPLPGGLAARLERGESPAFLTRMPLAEAAGDLKVWRVQR